MWDWLALRLRLLVLVLLLPPMLLSADGEEMKAVCFCVPELEAIGEDEAGVSCVPEVEALGEDEDDAVALLLEGFFTFFGTLSSESDPLLAWSGAFLLS